MATTETNAAFIDTPTFSIDIVPGAGDDGLSITTRSVLGRNALASGSLDLSPEQLQAYRSAITREGRFNGAADYQALANDATASPEDIKKAWAAYRNRVKSGKKVGIRNPIFDPTTNEVSFDIVAVPFPTYQQLALTNSSPEVLALAEATGTGAILQTADNRLVLQHRAVEKQNMLTGGKRRGNASYADIPGASVAGMLDARLDENGNIAPISTESVAANIKKEATEELGIDDADLVSLKAVGVVHDKVKPHHEVIFLARTNLTAAELDRASRMSKRNNTLSDIDFEEKFFDIEATPEAIFTLLTEVTAPLPPTHSAAFASAGYAMALERDGAKAADKWRAGLESGIRDNALRINQLVADYYSRFPDAVSIVPERYWKTGAPTRDLTGYLPTYTPEEQGLPNIEDELVRTGLLPETRHPVSQIALFDVDGVLTDLLEKSAPEALIDNIAVLLSKGTPVALNTGRSTSWVEEKVVKKLRSKLPIGSDMSMLSIIGEKGNTWTTYTHIGEANHGIAESVELPKGFSEEADAHIEARFGYLTGNHDPKQTMYSTEVNTGADLEAFKKNQSEITQILRELIEKYKLGDEFQIDETTISVDVQSKHAGKALGADRFLEVLRQQDIAYASANFEAFGDSFSDSAMAEELERRGLKGRFVYVGNDVVNRQAGYSYEIIHEPGYTAGTARVLADLVR